MRAAALAVQLQRARRQGHRLGEGDDQRGLQGNPLRLRCGPDRGYGRLGIGERLRDVRRTSRLQAYGRPLRRAVAPASRRA